MIIAVTKRWMAAAVAADDSDDPIIQISDSTDGDDDRTTVNDRRPQLVRESWSHRQISDRWPPSARLLDDRGVRRIARSYTMINVLSGVRGNNGHFCI